MHIYIYIYIYVYIYTRKPLCNLKFSILAEQQKSKAIKAENGKKLQY